MDDHSEAIEEAYRDGILTKAEAESVDAWEILQQANGRSLDQVLDAAEKSPLSKADADRVPRVRSSRGVACS